MSLDRLSTGVPGLDSHLGGGLLPGRLTVVVGAAGAGKTQLGLQFAHGGQQDAARRGILLDLMTRGDAQSHAEYAERLFGWTLRPAATSPLDASFFDPDRLHGDYLRVFPRSGRRVQRGQLDFDEQRLWQAELNQRLQAVVAFVYGRLLQGSRRVVVDGVEPVDSPLDSIQFDLFEYLYHQILRKDPEWVARDLFRQAYRSLAAQAAQHRYDMEKTSCMLLWTSSESLLDDLIAKPLAEGDALANANTVILMGRVRDGAHIRRGLYIAKHRGSPCTDRILTYDIKDRGVVLSSSLVLVLGSGSWRQASFSGSL